MNPRAPPAPPPWCWGHRCAPQSLALSPEFWGSNSASMLTRQTFYPPSCLSSLLTPILNHTNRLENSFISLWQECYDLTCEPSHFRSPPEAPVGMHVGCALGCHWYQARNKTHKALQLDVGLCPGVHDRLRGSCAFGWRKKCKNFLFCERTESTEL